MKPIIILFPFLMPVLITGQQIIYKGPKPLPEQKFKPGQKENLLKVICTGEDFDAYNNQADYAIHTYAKLINFPKFGAEYTVLKKTSDGFYLLWELHQDNYWSEESFKKVNFQTVILPPIKKP